MRLGLIVFSVIVLAGFGAIADDNEPAESKEGCHKVTTCEPCNIQCHYKASSLCIDLECAIKTVCTDTPPVCTKSCNVSCVDP